MKDFRVVQAKVLLKITSMAPIRGFEPPAIIVMGEKLNLAQEILYNNIQVEEFVVASPTRLIVRIPSGQYGKPLRTLQVLTSATLASENAKLSLGITSPLRPVEGIDRMVQEFLLIFYSTPGSDLFNPDAGGGGLAIVGKSSGSGGSSAAAALTQAVDRARKQLIQAQSKNSRIPPAERLLSATLTEVNFDPGTTEVSGTADLRNVLGGAASISIR